jgi:hypothetical protein
MPLTRTYHLVEYREQGVEPTFLITAPDGGRVGTQNYYNLGTLIHDAERALGIPKSEISCVVNDEELSTIRARNVPGSHIYPIKGAYGEQAKTLLGDN